MAFDGGDAAYRRAASASTPAGSGGFGSLPAARAASARGLGAPPAPPPPASYQGNAGTAWAAACSRAEDELRRCGAQIASLRKCADALGTPRDTEELRGKLAGALARGREGLLAVGELIKGELPAAGASDEGSLSGKERGERKLKLQRFGRDAELAAAQYKEVRAGPRASPVCGSGVCACWWDNTA